MPTSNDDGAPVTLAQARQVAIDTLPAPDAGEQSWRTYRTQIAEIYARVATSDPAHSHEAQYLADRALRLSTALDPRG